jgi:Xaa-Pro aminopeptidase
MKNASHAAVLALTLLPGLAAAGELQDELAARRSRLAQRLGPDTMLVLKSAPARVYSNDVDYDFRQDSNLYYLTGIDQEDTALVLLPGLEVLFTLPRDPAREHREGRRLSRDEAKARSGVATVMNAGDLTSFLSSVMERRSYPPRPYGPPASESFARALAEGRAKVAFAMAPAPLDGPLPEPQELASRLRERYPQVQVIDARAALANLRQVKTPYERALLTRSVDISAKAMREAMKAGRPGAFEYTVRAALEHEWSSAGALGWGYPPIVASGPNATILHYPRYDRQLQKGDLLLIDAAASYEYLTGDITRTFPVSGRFGPEQRAVYELVYAAQEAGIAAARAGVKARDIHEATVRVIKDGLLKLGLITDAGGDQYRTWYTHGSVHYIGMDVHDVGDYERVMEPGSAFVIEPGLYIREEALDALPPSPENKAFIEKVRPAVQKYKDVGVRIEDSFLLTEAGLQNLSAGAPRAPADVESLLTR